VGLIFGTFFTVILFFEKRNSLSTEDFSVVTFWLNYLEIASVAKIPPPPKPKAGFEPGPASPPTHN